MWWPLSSSFEIQKWSGAFYFLSDAEIANKTVNHCHFHLVTIFGPQGPTWFNFCVGSMFCQSTQKFLRKIPTVRHSLVVVLWQEIDVFAEILFCIWKASVLDFWCLNSLMRNKSTWHFDAWTECNVVHRRDILMDRKVFTRYYGTSGIFFQIPVPE